MKNYEKPFAEIVDFTNEAIMDDEGGITGGFSTSEGWEDVPEED